LKVAISPCPNDTLAFSSLIQKGGLDLSLHDIETLNSIARSSQVFDITKLSVACLPYVLDDYIVLPVGAAFAEKGGPKLIAKGCASVVDLLSNPLAIPGKNTSAYCAFCMLYGVPKYPVEMKYEEVIPAVKTGGCCGGIVIHEGRCACKSRNVREIANLGIEYRKRFSHLLPLGVIVAKRSLPQIRGFSLQLQSSIQEGRLADSIPEYVLAHAPSSSLESIQEHIKAYVTEETEMMSSGARDAICFFLEEGVRSGTLSPLKRSDIVASI